MCLGVIDSEAPLRLYWATQSYVCIVKGLCAKHLDENNNVSRLLCKHLIGASKVPEEWGGKVLMYSVQQSRCNLLTSAERGKTVGGGLIESNKSSMLMSMTEPEDPCLLTAVCL
jgi:hypothetical protein